MKSVGLVLGAGGIVGAAFHAGVLAALDDHIGWDARTASLVVGTSAGSGIGATVRAGLEPAEFLARATGGMPAVDLPRRPSLGRRLPRPAAPWLVWPPRARPGRALAGLLPAGTIPTAVVGERIRTLYGDRRWPDEPLWICALRLGDGRRVVFGRDESPTPDVGTACEASSAIPGFFEPVRIDGESYVDGGAHSPTNADLVAGLGLDVVVVVSPMSAVRSALRTLRPTTVGRRFSGAALAQEVRRVRADGTPVLTIQPTADDLAVMGVNAMDPGRRADVARRAFESTKRRLDDPRAAEVVSLLVA